MASNSMAVKRFFFRVPVIENLPTGIMKIEIQARQRGVQTRADSGCLGSTPYKITSALTRPAINKR